MKKKIYISPAPRGRKSSTRITPMSSAEAEQRVIIPSPSGDTIISPIVFYNNKRGGKSIRPRLIGDEIAQRALPKGERPSRLAIKMANALKLEAILESGHYANITTLSRATGIRRDTLIELLNLLNRDVQEIERILFELH